MLITYGQAFYDLRDRLQPLYDEREAAALAHEILYFVTGLDKTQRLLHKEKSFNAGQQEQYDKAAAELIKGKPLQYITGAAWFLGRGFHVNEHVLIPRPETEELVHWIITDHRANGNGHPIQMLDIGTGSGCIPVSLKLAIPDALVTSCDVSEDALKVAARNAEAFYASVTFDQLDFLDSAQHHKLASYDIIVSNPPYIPNPEKERLHTNVRDHEPSLALFVPDDDALVFYRAIATFGNKHLNTNGYIYCELDAGHAQECKELFEQAGYSDVLLRKDMSDNWRMLRARK